MLHGALPRAFLAPGLNYLSYYSEEVHPAYAAPPATWHIPMEDPSSPVYSRIPTEHHSSLQSWESSRSSTPCPLDLSLKPPSTPKTEEMIEVGDEKDLRTREDDQQLVVDDFDTLRSPSAHYERLIFNKESPRLHDSVMDKVHLPEESTRLPPYPNDFSSKYHQKLLMTSPTQSIQGYHQQLLLTPQHHLQGVHAPMTPPSTPSPPQCPRRRVREEDLASPSSGLAVSLATPKQSSAEKSSNGQRPKKKHARRLKFDEDTSSPVSGTVILGPDEAVVTGDIDPAFNIVEVTEEARAELAKIENRLGPYQCKLCRQLHEDAFQLAQHRCSRIAHVEYRCPECDKRFSCPANLASHRRWHKPRLPNNDGNSSSPSSSSTSTSAAEIPCTRCEAKFTRQAALRKHLAAQHPETNNTGSSNSSSDAQDAVVKPEVVQTLAASQLTNEMT
ncbi:PREDICTED: insulinoma-associated protein 1a-like [Dinoponera quadriceps]|uniref:Insulinoma-associated protein 1a-like n=1 Tax=Dinoponera quadriceps TaxID=609295 RepID=A0A6P3WRC0_DINQU|nr:PREDICTED: insulinoma-associated protein 1a-like [Dinoponera quadriceps]